MIFGVTRTVNFAQAIFAILSAYLSYTLFVDIGLDPFLSVLVLVPAMFAFGGGIYILMLRRLSGPARNSPCSSCTRWASESRGAGLRLPDNTRVIAPAYANSSWTIAGYQIPVVRFYAFVLAAAVLYACT